jgi:hypothetical protein
MPGLGVQGLGFTPEPRKRKEKKPAAPRDPDAPKTYNWSSGESERHKRLPADWRQRRQAVLKRCGGVCEVPECQDRATDVDHVKRGDNHDLANLQGLCRHHHALKSSAEGNEQQRINRQRINRPPEQHPGLIGFEPPQYPQYPNRNTNNTEGNHNDQ